MYLNAHENTHLAKKKCILMPNRGYSNLFNFGK